MDILEKLSKLTNESDGIEEKTFTISGNKNQIAEFEQMLGYIQYLGNIGHSTGFKVGVDGDGAARLSFKCDNKDILKINDNMQLIKDRMNADSDIENFSFN